ncbi:MAG: DinB family protein [Bacteroidetes bacterium]|nr:DinB family protein [Bacteroidota bacterium]MBU1373461.1 DinB family protein [Bacteroidota bacterium]MBU1485219.1 DinB family protein [Bacteroidota bacterium]MBU1761410.1 DinB family protein [Bacteroidota bacterium]MBU2045483.1 DinB family protein [Bacteroidota bacterium]
MYQPLTNEYNPFYEGYIQLASAGNQPILKRLKSQLNAIDDFLADIPEKKYDYAYADGKWTVKQVISHLIDTERVMTYRAMRIARNDQTDLPGYDQDLIVANTDIDKYSYEDLVDELVMLRQANLFFFKCLTDDDMRKKGTANGNVVSAGALLFIIYGHIEHHFNILKEKYLKK